MFLTKKDGIVLEYFLPALIWISLFLEIFFVIWNINVLILYCIQSSWYESIAWYSYWAVYKSIIDFMVYPIGSICRLIVWGQGKPTPTFTLIINVVDGYRAINLVALIIMYGQTNVAFWISYWGNLCYIHCS